MTTPVAFCYWLEGFLHAVDQPTLRHIEAIKSKLEEVIDQDQKVYQIKTPLQHQKEWAETMEEIKAKINPPVRWDGVFDKTSLKPKLALTDTEE